MNIAWIAPCFIPVSTRSSRITPPSPKPATNKAIEYTNVILKWAIITSPMVGGDNGFGLKPEPGMLVHVMEQLGVKKDRTVLIGDSTNDINGGHNAGIRVCAVGYGMGNRQKMAACQPDWFIERPEELMELFMISITRARTIGVVILSGILAAAAPGYAESPSLADRVIEHKLANGMTVLMVERHQAPIVSINMTFGVGGVNEQVGLTGFKPTFTNTWRLKAHGRSAREIMSGNRPCWTNSPWSGMSLTIASGTSRSRTDGREAACGIARGATAAAPVQRSCRRRRASLSWATKWHCSINVMVESV